MNFYKAFINFLSSFDKAFHKPFEIKPIQIHSPVLTTISRENIIETQLTLKKRRQAKFCLVGAWS